MGMPFEILRAIRGHRGKQAGAHVQYAGVRYSNAVLGRCFNLVGARVRLLVDPDDIRVVGARLEDGLDLRWLHAAEGRLGDVKTLAERHALLTRVRRPPGGMAVVPQIKASMAPAA